MPPFIKKLISRWKPSSGFFWQRPSWLLTGFGKAPPEDEQRLGWLGEQAAARYLKKKGYRLLAHGHRQRLGEIDLIALEGQCLVFVEVKTWRSNLAADPSEAVHQRKQERLTRAALIYLKQHRLLDHPARFDVISIVWPEDCRQPTQIRHFENAFEAVGNWQMHR